MANVEKEIKAVLQGLEIEEIRELSLAEARTDTGDRLVRLEKAAALAGLHRSEVMAALIAETRRKGLEELTDGAVCNRKRMARIRRDRPPEVAKKLLVLSPSRQKAVVAVSPDRLEEFFHHGVPSAVGRMPLKTAKSWDVVRAVKVSKTTPDHELLPNEMPRKPQRCAQFDWLMVRFRRLGSLTAEQATEMLFAVVSLLMTAPNEAQRTTRRLFGSFGLGPDQDGTAAVEELLRTLDGLPGLWQRLDVGPKVDRTELIRRACGKMSLMLLAISRWAQRRAA